MNEKSARKLQLSRRIDGIHPAAAWSIRVASIVFALIVGGLLLLALGYSPLKAYGTIIDGSLGSKTFVRQTIKIAIPLLGCAQDALVDLGTHDVAGGDPGGKAGVVGSAQALLQHRRRLGQCKDELIGGAHAHVDAGIDAIGKLGLEVERLGGVGARACKNAQVVLGTLVV